MVPLSMLVRAGVAVLSDQRLRRTTGWIIAAILSPLILLLVFLCSIAGGTAEHNLTTVSLCFYGGSISNETPEFFRDNILDMRDVFQILDALLDQEKENGVELDRLRVKAVYYALYFGKAVPDEDLCRNFVRCFLDPETGEVTEDMQQVYRRISQETGQIASLEQQRNADSVYHLVRYGSSAGMDHWIPGADVPFIGTDGFCAPVGSGWEERVTSEFGYRRDPFTGEIRGHSGIDIAVPTGTPIRAALPGMVTVSAYNAGGYGYYVMIDHGDGLVTLYAHCSRLLARVGQSVATGDIIALSGSTGRSTGPHLHFEVRVNGQRTNPRRYLPIG